MQVRGDPLIQVSISQKFLTYKMNGISRDSSSLIAALADNPEIELTGTRESDPRPLQKFILMLTTVIFRQPRIYKSDFAISLIPQIQNYLPNSQKSALIRIHDVFPITNPKWFRKISAVSFKITLARAVVDGHTFLCNSKYTQKCLLEIFPSASTHVLYCNTKQPDLYPCKKCTGCNLGSDFAKKYLISVSTIEPRKNYPILVEAWNRAKPHVDQNLVIVGRYGWKSKKTLKKIQNARPSVVYMKDVCDSGVRSLISSASAYVSVSLDEGFNFPAMDAALLGIPLIISDIPVHRELYGDSANYINPKSISEIEKAIIEISRKPPEISKEFLEQNVVFNLQLKKFIEIVNSKKSGGML